jgi:2-polyprenyl-6-hydroxyphenyl methylase/3-demethylubiquinone-9 3-methyltransferase
MGYYADKLSGKRLRECYEIAPPRVKQYLEEEIRYTLSRINQGEVVLELGCGYGRVAMRLALVATRVIGIDTSSDSVAMARDLAGSDSNCEFLVMDAQDLEFANDTFDAVICIQNGICAFNVGQRRLLEEAVRVTRPGGRALFSSYSGRFWQHRLEWFELQASRGLVGKIDYGATGNGVIVCEDGFRAGAMSQMGFEKLCESAGLACSIIEVDRSVLFCEVTVPGTATDHGRGPCPN